MVVHLVWLCVTVALLFVLYKYKQWEIDDLKEVIEHGRTYLKQRSDYYTEKDLDLKGKLEICAVSPNITKDNLLVLKFLEANGTERIEAIDGKRFVIIAVQLSQKLQA